MQKFKSIIVFTLSLLSLSSFAGASKVTAGDVYNNDAIVQAAGNSPAIIEQQKKELEKQAQEEQPGLPAAPGGPRAPKKAKRASQSRGTINSRDVIDQEAIRNGRSAEDVLKEDAAAYAQIERDLNRRERQLEECRNWALLISTLTTDLRTEEYKLRFLRGTDAVRVMDNIRVIKNQLADAQNQWNNCSAKLSR